MSFLYNPGCRPGGYAYSPTYVGRTADGRCRGFAHIEFENEQDAKDAIAADQEDPIFLLDRDLIVDFAPKRVVSIKEPHHKLYIFDFVGTEDELKDAFKDYSSSIIDVHLSE